MKEKDGKNSSNNNSSSSSTTKYLSISNVHYSANNVVVILFNWIEREKNCEYMKKSSDFANECYARKNRHRFSIRLHSSSFALVNENQTNVTLFIESVQTEKARAWKRATERKWGARAIPAATTTKYLNWKVTQNNIVCAWSHDNVHKIENRCHIYRLLLFSLSLSIFLPLSSARAFVSFCV